MQGKENSQTMKIQKRWRENTTYEPSLYLCETCYTVQLHKLCEDFVLEVNQVFMCLTGEWWKVSVCLCVCMCVCVCVCVCASIEHSLFLSLQGQTGPKGEHGVPGPPGPPVSINQMCNLTHISYLCHASLLHQI